MKRTDPAPLGWLALVPLTALGVASCTVFDGLSAVDRSTDAGGDTEVPAEKDSGASDTLSLDTLSIDTSTDTNVSDTNVDDSTATDTTADTAPPVDTSVTDTGMDTTPLTKAERYRAAVLMDSPLLYLRLDEMTGTLIAVDSSPNLRDCAYGGAELGLAGAMTGSSAARINNPGTNENIECESTPFDFSGTQPFTVEAWINAASLPAGFPRIVSKEVGSPRSGYSVAIKSSTSEVIFERWDAGTLRTYTARPFPGTARWVHIAASWNGTDAKLFVDGVADSKTYTGLTFTGNSRPLTFGLASSGVGEGLPGLIDEVAVYGTALSTTRIAAHISAATAP